MGRHEHKRKVRNYLVNPRFQFKFTVYFIVSGVAVVGILVALIYNKLKMAQDMLASPQASPLALQAQLNTVMFDITTITIVTFVLFTLVSFIYAIIISHRIAGPVVAICKYIDDIKAGDYDTDRTLRQYDELKPIMDKLNDLATSLKSSKP